MEGKYLVSSRSVSHSGETRARLCHLAKKVFQIAPGIHARGMIHGEYESVKALRSIDACYTPRPISTSI